MCLIFLDSRFVACKVCHLTHENSVRKIVNVKLLPAVCLRSYAGLFPLSGQLQPVCGTDGLRPASAAAVYAGFQAGNVYGHKFYRLNPVESVP